MMPLAQLLARIMQQLTDALMHVQIINQHAIRGSEPPSYQDGMGCIGLMAGS